METLGHKFINRFNNSGNGHFMCEVCGFRVFIGKDILMYNSTIYHDNIAYIEDSIKNKWKIIDISCEEMQIKNLLE